MTEENRYEVCFYFVSGETMNVTYSYEKLKEMTESLRKAWNHCTATDCIWGINFVHVTHYKVKEVS